jgi:hypothetical protein
MQFCHIMKSNDISEFIRSQLLWLRRRAETDDEKACLTWWVSQVEQLANRAPDPKEEHPERKAS